MDHLLKQDTFLLIERRFIPEIGAENLPRDLLGQYLEFLCILCLIDGDRSHAPARLDDDRIGNLPRLQCSLHIRKMQPGLRCQKTVFPAELVCLPFIVADTDHLRCGHNHPDAFFCKLFPVLCQHIQIHVKQGQYRINVVFFAVIQQKRNICLIVNQRGHNCMICIVKARGNRCAVSHMHFPDPL